MPTKQEYQRRKEKALEETKNAPSKKKCYGCNKIKTLENYNKLCSGKWGRNPRCKICTQEYNTKRYFSSEEHRKKTIKKATERNRKTKYGISPEAFNSLLIAQNNCCAICNTHLDGNRFSLKPQLDHCHKTNKIRGILCGQCNTSIGNFKDSEDILLSAIKYLRKYR